MERILIKITVEEEDLIPLYSSKHAAGADLRACTAEPLTIPPGGYKLIKTGLRIEIPPGYEAQVRPRSGLALKHGISILNAPGTIDADYRGEVGVILINLSNEPFLIKRGDRIAQLIIAPVLRADFQVEKELTGTARGGNGFGSTGVE